MVTKLILTLFLSVALRASTMTTVLDPTTFQSALFGIGAVCAAHCTPDPPEFDRVLEQAFFGVFDPGLTVYVLPSPYGYELFLEPPGSFPPGFTDPGTTFGLGGSTPLGNGNPVNLGPSFPLIDNNPPFVPPTDPPSNQLDTPPNPPFNPPPNIQLDLPSDVPLNDPIVVPEPGTWSVALGLLVISGRRLGRWMSGPY
jgi:hypothetical protein